MLHSSTSAMPGPCHGDVLILALEETLPNRRPQNTDARTRAGAWNHVARRDAEQVRPRAWEEEDSTMGRDVIAWEVAG